MRDRMTLPAAAAWEGVRDEVIDDSKVFAIACLSGDSWL